MYACVFIWIEQAQAGGVYRRIHSCHDDSLSPLDTDDAFDREVDFQVQQATSIQELYNSLGESSMYVSVFPDN